MSADYASTLTYAVSGSPEGLEDWIGTSVAVDAPYPIEAGRVADFCSLIEDANPVYWDADLATARFGGPVAPPAMLSGARFPSPWRPDGRPKYGPVSGIQVPLPTDTLINAGFNCWYDAAIRVGDRLTYTEEITSISDRKRTSLGEGWFVTTKCDVTNQDKAPVAGYENIMLRYSSGTAEGGEKAATPFQPTPTADGVPEITVPVTYTLCALVVAGTRDYFPGHHDPEYARAQGVADVYPNTGFYCGLIDRVALEWAEFEGTIRRRNLRMFRPAPAGTTLKTGGRVVDRREEDGGPVADLVVDVFTAEALVAQANVTVRLHKEQ